ncbi:MAG: hypothetical protein IJJ83_09230 [Muribaculaceae bacterium]|nr:hypothetical protein [Muribaculaceae bacterium]
MKKKCIFPVAVAAIMLIPLLASAAGPLNRIIYTASYNNNSMTIGTDTLGGVTYATVSYEGLYNGGEPGMPSLPIDYLKFSVPYNATNFTVTASTRWASQNLSYLVYPCQSPWMVGSPVPPIMLPDTSAYYSGNTYPSQMAWIADEGFFAGENHIVTVAVMPFRYMHSSNSDVLSRAINCVVTLRYDLSDSLAISPIVRNDSQLREEGYQLTQSMVVNPGQVKYFAPAVTFNHGIDSTGLIQGGIGGDLINGGGGEGGTPIEDSTNINIHHLNYPYLIVTTSDLKHAVRRIAALKRQKGYNVKVVTMDEVLSSYFSGNGDLVGEGRNAHLTYTDPAGKLRQYLRNHYKYYGTKYVLLAGNVPYKYTKLRTTELYNDSIILPSDMYYIDLNGDWHENDYDYHSELYVGRLLAKTTDQITNYTDKLLRYQLNPGKGNYDYLKRALYSQGYDFIQSGELYHVQRAFNKIYNNPIVLSESSNINDTSKYPSGEDIIDSINAKQCGFISLHHHGFPAGLLTYGFRNDVIRDYLRFLWAIDTVHTFMGVPERASDDPSDRNGLNDIMNKWYPSVCYASSCISMPFDTVSGYESIPMNFGESYTTGKDYGGPIFIGNTRNGITPYTSYLEKYLGQFIYQRYYQIGVANALAKQLSAAALTDSIGNRYTVINQNLLGDPELEIWTDVPEQFIGIEIERTDQAVSISGISADSTIVAYMQKNNVMQAKMISDSCVLNDASPNSPIMLYKHNYIPHIAPLLLQNESFKTSRYIITSDVMAGYAIDTNRSWGDVVIVKGIEYEIEASGTVTLNDGFKVEKGATFAVYPSCF